MKRAAKVRSFSKPARKTFRVFRWPFFLAIPFRVKRAAKVRSEAGKPSGNQSFFFVLFCGGRRLPVEAGYKGKWLFSSFASLKANFFQAWRPEVPKWAAKVAELFRDLQPASTFFFWLPRRPVLLRVSDWECKSTRRVVAVQAGAGRFLLADPLRRGKYAERQPFSAV